MSSSIANIVVVEEKEGAAADRHLDPLAQACGAHLFTTNHHRLSFRRIHSYITTSRARNRSYIGLFFRHVPWAG
jgi:hypothetical protein